MDTDSTKSEILEISTLPTNQPLATVLSAMTQVVEGMKNDLKTADRNRRRIEEKATKSRIQKEKVEKRDRADKREAEDKRRKKTEKQTKRKPRQFEEKRKERRRNTAR
mgnify:CR=1 FL=1